MNKINPSCSYVRNTADSYLSICAFNVLNSNAPKSVMEPNVFHMQHEKTRFNALFKPKSLKRFWSISLMEGFLTLGALAGGVSHASVAVAEDDPECINYYTVGESSCTPAASTPVRAVQGKSESDSAPKTVQSPKSDVDTYLDNYGKPPREFVEFYLNPTAENANKWMLAYRQMLDKGQKISKAWQDADQLYTASAEAQGSAVQSAAQTLREPFPVSTSQPEAPQQDKLVPPPSIGAFSNGVSASLGGLGGVRASSLSATYYFSQTCPYCARMTPQLADIEKEMKGRLALTCVDVTPLGVDSKPNEGFITSKLPCKWRLPTEGEVDSEAIRQTPTLLIQKEGGPKVRLSGYVPLAQLHPYFE